MKKLKKIKCIALFLCILMLMPVVLACGEKSADTAKATEAEGATEAATEAPVATDPPPPTEPPTTTEPPPTEPPKPPFVADPNLSYWDQIYSELEYYGFKGGVKALTGETEAELMKKMSISNGKREELDLSGDNSVPFSAAYKIWTTKDQTNFWDASYGINLLKDLPVSEGDIIAGVIWLKGKRIGESEMYAADDPVTYHLAVKTPTDWGTESNMNPPGDIEFDGDGWQKVFFTANVMYEADAPNSPEPGKSQNMIFNLYIGWGLQEFEVGGVIAWVFPLTDENELAAMDLVF